MASLPTPSNARVICNPFILEGRPRFGCSGDGGDRPAMSVIATSRATDAASEPLSFEGRQPTTHDRVQPPRSSGTGALELNRLTVNVGNGLRSDTQDNLESKHLKQVITRTKAAEDCVSPGSCELTLREESSRNSDALSAIGFGGLHVAWRIADYCHRFVAP